MKENNINQVTMEIEDVEVIEETERKGIIARAKDKVKDFGEKHPKIVKIGKGVGIAGLAIGAYALGKNSNAVASEDIGDEIDMEIVDVEFIENTEE